MLDEAIEGPQDDKVLAETDGNGLCSGLCSGLYSGLGNGFSTVAVTVAALHNLNPVFTMIIEVSEWNTIPLTTA